MKKTLIIFIMAFVNLVIFSCDVYAVTAAKSMSTDSRLQVIVYNSNDVFKFVGFYGYQSSIIFQSGEVVDSITMGDTIAWQIVPSNNRIFIKPMEDNATTNMTVITNKRVYYFELHAKEAKGINDPEMVFAVKFLYPDEGSGAITQYAESDELDLTEPGKYNFHYTISGPDETSPIKIFDDGEFTYFEFKDKNAELPAFFLVNSDATESMINYRISGKYIVVERVAKKFTLRHGSEVVCVFNEKMNDKKVSDEKKSNTIKIQDELQKDVGDENNNKSIE